MKEKDAPYKFCVKVLQRLQKAGVLQDIVLIGSWCGYFYKDYFKQKEYLPHIRTRDIDFLIATPPKIRAAVSLPDLLKDLGFIIDIKGSGVISLIHPELIIEFIVPEKGRGGSGPYPIKELGVNAQPLRFVNLLLDKVVIVKSHGLTLNLPNPLQFAFQKLIISLRRKSKDKQFKDRELAIRVLRACLRVKELKNARELLRQLPQKWQQAIRRSLETADETELIHLIFQD